MTPHWKTQPELYESCQWVPVPQTCLCHWGGCEKKPTAVGWPSHQALKGASPGCLSPVCKSFFSRETLYLSTAGVARCPGCGCYSKSTPESCFGVYEWTPLLLKQTLMLRGSFWCATPHAASPHLSAQLKVSSHLLSPFFFFFKWGYNLYFYLKEQIESLLIIHNNVIIYSLSKAIICIWVIRQKTMSTKMLLGREIVKRYLRLKIQHMLKYHETVTHQEKYFSPTLILYFCLSPNP